MQELIKVEQLIRNGYRVIKNNAKECIKGKTKIRVSSLVYSDKLLLNRFLQKQGRQNNVLKI